MCDIITYTILNKSSTWKKLFGLLIMMTADTKETISNNNELWQTMDKCDTTSTMSWQEQCITHNERRARLHCTVSWFEGSFTFYLVALGCFMAAFVSPTWVHLGPREGSGLWKQCEANTVLSHWDQMLMVSFTTKSEEACNGHTFVFDKTARDTCCWQNVRVLTFYIVWAYVYV